ncbi:hypothetical protein SELMODRAFT_432361 [Selaginella moellendorffii]|uniref:SET domain-containing protein n=1 Tax=Selaginella moellendorffii TaxID=88036 RepID=D8TFS2_SELML|nr:hypothetical protein SELMODRAFT_432361 [Selaginella moellendorffii]
MVSSPDRPPGSPGAPLDLNFQNANQVDEPTLSLDAREHQEEFSRGSGMDSHLGESNHFSRSDRELENALPLHQDKEDKGRGGRKTRWDPSPTKQGAQSESGNDLAYGQDNDLDERHTIGSRRASMISSSSSYGNGYADHDSRSRRYNDSRRCVTIQGNIRKDNYYRNDVKPSLEYKSSSYERSAVYDRGPHRFGTRNGFERRGDWCASRGSRDHRDWGNRSESRESYDARDRRCDREVFERRDWIRGAERDRRQVRSSEEWHSDDYRSSSGQWDSSSRFTSVQAAVPAFQANEGSAFLSSSHHLPPPSVEHESSTPPPPVAALQPVLGDPGTHVAMEIESDGQEQEDRDETYEPGEVKDGWVYINKNGDTQGPMELAALKLLASREFMPDDHLVMRCGTNAWITLEHAQSPDNGSSALQRLVNPVAATRNAKDATLAESTIDGNEQFQNESFEFLDIDGRVERILATCRASDQGNELKSVLSSAAPELSNPWKDSYNLGFGVDTDLECLDAVSRVVPPEPVPAPPPSTEEDLHHHDHNPSPLKWKPDIKAKCNHDLGRGDWFYKDGGGRERGPYSFAELQAMVGRELLIPGTSAYRKSDDLWVPLPRPEMDDGNFNVTEVTTSSFDGARRVRKVVTTNIQQTIMAFTSGQLHEHVMKHYKNQVMSAILFEGLDARAKLIESNRRLSTCSTVALLSGEDSWIGYGRSHPSPSSSNDTSDEREDGDQDHRPNRRPLFRSNGLSQEQTSRKRRLVYNDDVESSEDELPTGRRTRQRRLIRNDVFDSSDEHLYEAGQNNSWETLGQLMLMRIYHHLKGDLKSLALISMTCKSWRAAVEKFKPKVKCLDFTSIGVHCTDAVLSSVQQQNYGGGNLKQILLKDCTVLSPDALGKFLEACPTIQDVDINGCDQFGDLSHSFPQVNWVYDDSEVSDSATQGSDDSHRKMKSLNSIGTCSLSKDDEDVDESEPMDIDPCYSNEQDIDSMTQHSGYKRVKVTTDIKVLKDNGYLKGKRKTTVTKKLNKLRRSVKSVVLDEEFTEVDEYACDVREWGARMTKAAMVPPVTRKYEIIEDYWIVIDKDLVERKMQVEVPDDYEEKLRASKLKRGEYSHLDIPDIKNYHPRRELGVEVMEQEVYGIDPYTHNLLLDTMPKIPAMTLQEKLQFMEETLLQAINKEGLGVVCNKDGGFKEDDFVVEFFGEVYPAWRWYEKQDGCRYLQKKDKEPLPEFYNILLERPKGDAAGYDLVVVDAMHKANFASRICHSCRPNCEAKVTAVKGRYIIGVYALRPIQNGEELTFDYNSVTESKEEYNNSICLCGSQCCRGSYLNLANAGASQDVIKERHGLLDRHVLLLEACCEGPVTRLELEEMRQAGVGSCLLDGLPDWLLKYTARLVEFMNLERQLLPDELMRSVKKKRKDADLSYELGRVDAENQAEGVYNQRLQNIAITLDKVRYVLRQLFTDPREAPPLLKKLDQKELVSRLWSAENSIVNELLSCMMPHIPADRLAELKRQRRGYPDSEMMHWLKTRPVNFEGPYDD